MMVERERIVELLVDYVTEGLEPQGECELEELAAGCSEVDIESFELAAAAIELAVPFDPEPLPTMLRQRLLEQANHYFESTRASRLAAAPTP